MRRWTVRRHMYSGWRRDLLCSRHCKPLDVRVRPRENDLTVTIPNVIAIEPAHLFTGEPKDAIEYDQEEDFVCMVADPTGFRSAQALTIPVRSISGINCTSGDSNCFANIAQ
jgi:hypothetical protein